MSRKSKLGLYGGASAFALTIALGGAAYASGPPVGDVAPEVTSESAVLDHDVAAKLMVDVKNQYAAEIQTAAVQNNPGTGKASDQGKAKNNNKGHGNGTYTG
jgi:hypothetical protein